MTALKINIWMRKNLLYNEALKAGRTGFQRSSASSETSTGSVGSILRPGKEGTAAYGYTDHRSPLRHICCAEAQRRNAHERSWLKGIFFRLFQQYRCPAYWITSSQGFVVVHRAGAKTAGEAPYRIWGTSSSSYISLVQRYQRKSFCPPYCSFHSHSFSAPSCKLVLIIKGESLLQITYSCREVYDETTMRQIVMEGLGKQGDGGARPADWQGLLVRVTPVRHLPFGAVIRG